MNFNYFEARQHFSSGPLLPAYLFYGKEAFLREELEQLLSMTFLGEGLSFGREKVEGKTLTLTQALERVIRGNLFAPRQLLVIDRPPYLAPPREGAKDIENVEETAGLSREEDPGLKLLERFLESSASPPQQIIVFQSPAVDRRKKVFKMLSGKGLVVDCAPLKKDELERWIKGRTAQAGKTIERAALEQLLLSGDGELWHLANELAKYIAYLEEDQDKITGEVVELLYAGDSQGSAFKLADALSEGNLPRSLEMLQLLLARREKPLQIFFLLVRHFRLLFAAWDFRRERISPDEFARAMKLHPFAARKLYQQVAAYELTTLEEILLTLRNIDRRIKTGALDANAALKIALGQIHHLCSHPYVAQAIKRPSRLT